MNEAPLCGRRPAKLLGLWELGGLPWVGEGWPCSGGPGMGVESVLSGETPELGMGCSRRGCVSRPVAPLSHLLWDQRFVPGDCHQRKFDVRRRRPTLGDVGGPDWLGVPYKLLAGCLGSGSFNVTYYRLFLKIRYRGSNRGNFPKIPWNDFTFLPANASTPVKSHFVLIKGFLLLVFYIVLCDQFYYFSISACLPQKSVVLSFL